MKCGRFKDEKIIVVLKENEARARVDEFCRRHGFSSATSYDWRKKFGGMDASDARKFREIPLTNGEFLDIDAAPPLDPLAGSAPVFTSQAHQKHPSFGRP